MICQTRDRRHRERADVHRVEDEGQPVGEEQREQDERREEEAGDLRDRVLDHRDRRGRTAPLAASVIPTTFSTALPGDADDHDAGERLRDPERLHRRVERVDEPVGDERRRDAGRGQQDERRRERQVARGAAPRAPARVACRSAGTTRARRRRRRAGRPRRPPRSRPRARSPGRRAGRRGRAARSRRARAAAASPCRSAAACGSASPRRRPSRAPATIASPSTSRAFANSEPRIDVWATTISPAESANSTMKSSGRLPSVDWSAPGDGRAEARADRLRGDADEPGEPAERQPRDDEDRRRRRVRVVERAC